MASQPDQMSSQKRKRSPEPPSSAPNANDIYRSDPIEDRSSTFIGYYSPTLSGKELQSIAEIKSASHKILAWRKQSTQRSLTGNAAQYNIGNDDDGEKYGGKAVEKILVQMNVTGSCVVARWYGGVMLGRVRFQHMEDCAREAVRRWQGCVEEEQCKKRRVEEESMQRGKLVKALGERDRSIEVLRALAAEKETKVKDALVVGMADLDGDAEASDMGGGDVASRSSQATEAVSPKKPPVIDYTAIPIDRLRALDKARDATLAFLLKRISKAEAGLAALGEPDKPP